MKPLADIEARLAAVTDLGTTFLVEAGAGTGKTSVLVDRFIACLLDDEQTPIDRVVAITFTDKAAGELRQRVRRRLEELLSDPGQALEPFGALDAARLERLAAALAGLERAPISTIHAFAARLLRERPVEAGIDPAFAQLDALGSELLLDRLWEDWLGSMLDTSPDDPDTTARLLAGVLAAEVRLSTLRALAMNLAAQRYQIDEPPPPSEPDLSIEIAAAKATRQALAAAALRCTADDDRLLIGIRDLTGVLARLPGEGSLHELGAALLVAASGKYGGRNGAKANWGGAKDQVMALRDEALAHLTAGAGRYQAYVAELALVVSGRFAQFAAQRQIALGQLDFDDLLGKARDLLLQPGPRRFFQEQFRYLLVDEFQDTDPLQAEIVFLLAEREPQATRWDDVALFPGKLFLVGDAKQSIYRFRGADIATYRRVRRLIGAAAQARVLTITTNFRTVPSITGWVNHTFARLFVGDAEVQADYAALDPARDEPAGAPRVVVVEAPLGEKARIGRKRQQEALVMADLLSEIARAEPSSAWIVHDRVDGADVWRPARLGDVTILFPTFTGIDAYERALRQAEIPYRVEGGRTYFRRREVRDVVLALRAIDDASNALATYAALHSSLFGFSDDDLFAFHLAGGSFDYLASQTVDQGSPTSLHGEILAALAMLRELHEGRIVRPLVETIERLLRETRFLELQAAFGDGSEQALGNLARFMTMAEQYAAQSQPTFHGLVRYLADAVTKAEVAESPVGEEGDFVRLITVHRAKGLEFPIVMLANALSGRRGRLGGDGVRTLLDRPRRRLECTIRTQAGNGADCASAAWAVAQPAEADANAEERRRLAYVACTRASDYLVVPRVGDPEGDGALLALLESALRTGAAESDAADDPQGDQADDATALVRRVQWQPGERRPAAGRPAPDVEAIWQRRTTWRRERAVALRAAAVPAPVTSPSRLELLSFAGDERGEEVPMPVARSVALALGSAVHRVLEQVSLDDAAVLAPGGAVGVLAVAAADEARVPDLGERVADLAAACWQAPPLREAAAAAVCLREMPVAVCVGEAVVEGYVDLLYGDGDGYVVVDYKTDSRPDPQRVREMYELQGAAYALAVEAATGRAVREVVFVLAAADPPPPAASALVRVAPDEALRARLLARIAEATAAGEPIAADLSPAQPG